jgi:hypothetical protein
MADKLKLIAAEAFTNATTIVGGVVIADILDYRTYVNNLGQTVAVIETTTGLLPAIKIDVPNTATAQPAPKVDRAADVAQPNKDGEASPFAVQYEGSSKTAGGFPDAH